MCWPECWRRMLLWALIHSVGTKLLCFDLRLLLGFFTWVSGRQARRLRSRNHLHAAPLCLLCCRHPANPLTLGPLLCRWWT